MYNGNEKLQIYWAGALFKHQELLGNLQLAKALETVADGRVAVHLPQDGETETSRDAIAIRNADLAELCACDAIVANFDGPELDSGTVLEFAFAKALDLPAVLLRTDFRNGGDTADAPWNLMLHGWPRTETLWLNSMRQYHTIVRARGAEPATAVAEWNRAVATQVLSALESVCAMPSWLTADDALAHYRRTIRSAGGDLELLLTDDRLAKIIARKRRVGLLHPQASDTAPHSAVRG
jgi:nucleoside 2-deoxyribosyltransferase